MCPFQLLVLSLSLLSASTTLSFSAACTHHRDLYGTHHGTHLIDREGVDLVSFSSVGSAENYGSRDIYNCEMSVMDDR